MVFQKACRYCPVSGSWLYGPFAKQYLLFMGDDAASHYFWVLVLDVTACLADVAFAVISFGHANSCSGSAEIAVFDGEA